ncbi:MAG: aldo/keto reductase [Clostridiaceae bacterium]|nr:aldo/keto reductase [Clostridiaceae bacterium]
MEKRRLGKSGFEVSPMGIGCWAIGGQFFFDGKVDGYGTTDDQESIRAVQTALDLGINFIDTADCYGIGHSEELLGIAIEGRRPDVILATKFGHVGNAETKTLQGVCYDPAYIERALEASLKRLRTDYIDLYQFHIGDVHIAEADIVFETLDKLVQSGKIRSYGWSTNALAPARYIASRAGCTAIQHDYNILHDSDDMLHLCEKEDLASINRSPLAMGFLSGKFNRDTQISKNDVRGAGHVWTENIFKDGRPIEEVLFKLDAVREILTSEGRTLTQGALAWIWGKSPVAIPIPGFKNVAQVEQNIRAISFGPLNEAQMKEIDALLGR